MEQETSLVNIGLAEEEEYLLFALGISDDNRNVRLVADDYDSQLALELREWTAVLSSEDMRGEVGLNDRPAGQLVGTPDGRGKVTAGAARLGHISELPSSHHLQETKTCSFVEATRNSLREGPVSEADKSSVAS